MKKLQFLSKAIRIITVFVFCSFQFLHVWTLRDYLVHDLSIPGPTATADCERLIDDFVFMCIFVGNDFLPHVPSLDIKEVGILNSINLFAGQLGF